VAEVRTDGVHGVTGTQESGTHASGPEAKPRPPRQEQEEASEEVAEVAPGVLRMQLPIWMPGLGHVNMYGLVDERGLAVVDPGLPGPQSWKALKARLKSAGYKVKDIHTVVVTHSHPDHFGGAGRIAKEAGAQLVTHHAFSTWTVKGPTPQRALSEGEARRIEVEAAEYAQAVDVPPDEIPTINDVVPDDTTETETTSSPWGASTPWGTTNQGPPLKRRMMIKAMRILFKPPEPTTRMHHGEKIRLANRDWFIVHTPGHTVDHLCLWDPESGTLLTGDHVLPSITPHVSGVRKADSLNSYLATLDLVAQLQGVTIGLPAHGHPFPDVAGRVEAIKEHHAERMELLRDAGLALGPATVVDLSHEVFPKRHWGTMAESETFAHLEHLEHAGQAERWEENGMLVYRMQPKADTERGGAA
jgi:glyoxylase-like metal-dependent hydrolase (beta-lactamase superfamily II)